jgi:ubiquinone/menaquinone biosynthesis C-methylase UbiE
VIEEPEMKKAEVQEQWEQAAPGWARWEPIMADALEPATQTMLTMADIGPGAQVLDLACGAGSQTLLAARRVGAHGHVVASDIAKSMLQHVRESARASGLANITTLAGAAEDLDLAADTFDAVICRAGLMLFLEPARALRVVRHALKPGGKVAAVVFTTPSANQFMAQPMQVLLRHAGKSPPAPGQPGIFSLGAPGALEQLLTESGFVNVEQRTLPLSLRLLPQTP